MWLGNRNIILGTYLVLVDTYHPSYQGMNCNKFVLAGNQSLFYKILAHKKISYSKQAKQLGNQNPPYIDRILILAHKSHGVSQEPVVRKHNLLQSLTCKSLTCNQNPSRTVLPGVREL